MIDNYIERSRLLIRQGRYQQAEEEIRNALAIDPEDVEAITLFAYSQFYQGRLQAAIDWATKAAGRIEGYYWPYYIIAESNRRLNRDKKAMEAVRAGLAADPHAACFYGVKSLIQFENAQRKAAIKTVNEGLQLNPLEPQLLKLKTLHLYRHSKTDEAIATLHTLLKEEPNMFEVHGLKGWLALEKNQFDLAETAFRESLRLNPLSATGHKGLVLALAGRKWWLRSVLRFECWLHREPNSYLGLGFLYVVLLMVFLWSFSWFKWSLLIGSVIIALICFPIFTKAIAACYVRTLPDGKNILTEKMYNNCRQQLIISILGFFAVFVAFSLASEL